ncbi:MAG: hypothetical protein MRK02_03205 [Candidatus Scalindua sp.]|nr:hypothetical protein [Candidatus Scalindua sp.]
MEVGFGQLIWAIIFVIFLVITALKNRAKMKSGTNRERIIEEKRKGRERSETLSTYLEEILGIEEPERRPQRRVQENKQKITAIKKKPGPLKKSNVPEPEVKKRTGEFTSPLNEQAIEKKQPAPPKKRDGYHKKFPWETKSKEDLQGAIVFAEIIGPPIAKRKNHRLF